MCRLIPFRNSKNSIMISDEAMNALVRVFSEFGVHLDETADAPNKGVRFSGASSIKEKKDEGGRNRHLDYAKSLPWQIQQDFHFIRLDANELMEAGDLERALECYLSMWNTIPEPKEQWRRGNPHFTAKGIYGLYLKNERLESSGSLGKSHPKIRLLMQTLL